MYLRTLLAATGLAALAVTAGATAATAATAEDLDILGSVRDYLCIEPAAAGDIGRVLEPLTPGVVHCPTPEPVQE
ncbi:hypothetical protein ACFWTE_19615 [Nocardiopsis sp. NPDC058631]|uniref:hypothetical protein n=1 Tax=Nocardiopsis sp. NPDC058631 TaxID=3346566 RepID=UPI003655FEAA